MICFAMVPITAFQSTLPYGSDLWRNVSSTGSLRFQSTLPYGSDAFPLSGRFRACYFNPRSLTGATKLNGEAGRIKYISIHAPLRERPGGAVTIDAGRYISIHAPLRERRKGRPIKVQDINFNPRSLTGATQNSL